MAEHTGSDGKKYRIQNELPDGDIILLSDTWQYRTETYDAYWFKKSVLAASSPVFRDMFAGKEFAGSDIDLNVSSSTLCAFMAILSNPRPPFRVPDWFQGRAIYDLACLYECDSIKGDILYAASNHDPRGYRFEAFVLACEANHILAACRILRGAGEIEVDRAGTCLSLVPSSRGWTLQQVERLSMQWLWALTCGVQAADKMLRVANAGDRTSEDYWNAVVGEFVARLDA